MEKLKLCILGHMNNNENYSKQYVDLIKENLLENINNAIDFGVETIYLTCKSDFDILAMEVLVEVKSKNPFIQVYVYTETQISTLTEKKYRKTKEILDRCDFRFCPISYSIMVGKLLEISNCCFIFWESNDILMKNVISYVKNKLFCVKIVKVDNRT
ncbi:MAG TPA: SLOG family protein [Clostridia bacterium]|nr:SLOG family protein [Clostridia bacterium]